MKKLFTVLAMASVMVSCESKKKDSAPEVKKDTTSAPAPAASENATTSDVPKFTDPEVQKSANEYAAFMTAYKAAATDPAKLNAMQTEMQEWMDKSEKIHAGLAQKPEEAAAWAKWAMKLLDDAMPDAPKDSH